MTPSVGAQYAHRKKRYVVTVQAIVRPHVVDGAQPVQGTVVCKFPEGWAGPNPNEDRLIWGYAEFCDEFKPITSPSA